MSEANQGSKISSFIKGSTILVFSNVCLKAINFFLLPLYTNNLTPTMVGISDSIVTLTGIVFPLLTLGLDSAFSAFYFEKGDEERSRKVFSTLTWTFVLLGCIPILLMAAAPLVSTLLFQTADYSYIVRYALISVSFNLWYLTYSLELRLQNKMFLYGLSNLIASVTIVLLNILFVSVIHLGESSLILSTMIAQGEHLLLLLLFVKSKPSRKLFDRDLLKKMLRFAVPLIPMTLMVWILSLSDRYVLLFIRGEADVGLYGIGLRFMNLMNVVISAVTVAYTTFAFSSKDDKGSQKKYYYIYNIEAGILMCFAFTVSLFGKDIVHLMTAESYWESYRALRDLMFSQVFFAMTSIVGYGIYFEKKSVYSLIAVSAGAFLNLGLNLVLIPKYGISAAAFTTLLGYILYYSLMLFFSERVYPCEYGQRRVLLSLAALYAVCLAGSGVRLWIRILIWCVCMAGIVVLYRDILKIVIGYGKKILSRRKMKAQQRSSND